MSSSKATLRYFFDGKKLIIKKMVLDLNGSSFLNGTGFATGNGFLNGFLTETPSMMESSPTMEMASES
jgi:hypothetical protein